MSAMLLGACYREGADEAGTNSRTNNSPYPENPTETWLPKAAQTLTFWRADWLSSKHLIVG
jgi:hypothetical protein